MRGSERIVGETTTVVAIVCCGCNAPVPGPPPLIRFMLSCLELSTLARLLLVLLARLTDSIIVAPVVAELPVVLVEVEKIGATPSLAPVEERSNRNGH